MYDIYSMQERRFHWDSNKINMTQIAKERKYSFLDLFFITYLHTTRYVLYAKRGMSKLNFVCESARNSAPSWHIDPRFCMVGANVIYFSETKLFELTLFCWHEVNLHLPMFFRPETSSLVTQMQPTWKLRISGEMQFYIKPTKKT